MQQSLADMEYLIIDEMSMVGRKFLCQVDRRLRHVFPHRADTLFGGCSCLLFGDFGQLPPVMDLPLYTTMSRSPLSDQGSSAYQLFDHAVVLEQMMRQSGQDPDQVLFRDILRLRDARLTISDWEQLMKQTPAEVSDLAPFTNALNLIPTIEAVVEHNVAKIKASGHPVATIKAIHSRLNASKASSEDAGGLESIICLASEARVMLTANLWVEMGLVNGAMGTVMAICYRNGESPPALPIAVTVRFDSYRGPTLPDGTVPITPLRRTWSASGGSCSRLQLPLKLAWAITIHKAQGLTLDKVVIDIGKKEFSAGLTFVACSRVRRLKDLLFSPPFPFQRIANLSNSKRLQDRLLEDGKLVQLSEETLSHPSNTPISVSTTDHIFDTSSFPIGFHQTRDTPTPPSSPDVSHMDRDTPTPPSSPDVFHVHRDTPTPPSSPDIFHMDRDTPTPPSSPNIFHMDRDTPTHPSSPDIFHMDRDTPTPPSSPDIFHMDRDTPTPLSSPDIVHMDRDTPTPPSSPDIFHMDRDTPPLPLHLTSSTWTGTPPPLPLHLTSSTWTWTGTLPPLPPHLTSSMGFSS